jgi:hypothetical protein
MLLAHFAGGVVAHEQGDFDRSRPGGKRDGQEQVTGWTSGLRGIGAEGDGFEDFRAQKLAAQFQVNDRFPAGLVEAEDLSPAGGWVGSAVSDVPRIAPVGVGGKEHAVVGDEIAGWGFNGKKPAGQNKDDNANWKRLLDHKFVPMFQTREVLFVPSGC